MDFHSLTRKELQTLCKKNKIPANITNLAMADSLSALHQVEGIEEFLNQSQSESQQCSEEPQTASRTTARGKPVAREDLESSHQTLTRTRRATRRVAAAAEKDGGEGVPPETPAVPSGHGRRTAAVSVSKKTEIASVQRAYSTRRSIRLLENTLENLSLDEDVKILPMKIDDVSQDLTANIEKEFVDLVEPLDEKTDVEVESLVEKETESIKVAEFSEEIQNPKSKDCEDHQDLGTEGSLAVEILDEVSSEIIDQDIAPKTCSSRKEEKEESTEPISPNLSLDCTVEPAAGLESENLMKFASEESSETKIPAEISITLTSNGTAGSEEDSLSKVNAVEEEIPSSKPEILTEKSLAEISVNDIVGSEEGSLSKDNAVEAEVSDFESESDDNNSEEESTESEASNDEEYVDCDGDDESEASDSEASMVDVNVYRFEPRKAVSETSLIAQAGENDSPKQLEVNSSEEESEESEAASEEEEEEYESEQSDSEAYLVDADMDKVEAKEAVLETSVVAQAEENNSPLQSGAKIALPMPPFAADQLSGQFPRPTLQTPSKKNHPIIQLITDEVDGDKDDNEGNKDDENCSDDDKNNNFATTPYEKKSLIKLRKMLKHKLQLENNQKVEKTRIALQTLPENRLVVDEPLE